jgi:hypothetical protein
LRNLSDGSVDLVADQEWEGEGDKKVRTWTKIYSVASG